MNFEILVQYAPALFGGLLVTLYCWLSGGALGLALGFGVSLALRSQSLFVRWPLRAYIETLRGTPFLLQLFILYAGGPAIGLRLSATAAGIIGLGLYSSAYFAEIFRAGFGAVPIGQIEAAASVGMTSVDILRRISLPTALVSSLPAIVNMLIVLSKETVVLSIITVPELMYQAQTMAAETFTAFEAIFALAVFYWALVESASRVGAWAERRATLFLRREANAA
jgi:polar amino acid transport system permease protein